MYENENELNFEPNVGLSYGMYTGEAGMSVGDPYATYQQVPTSYAFMSGIQESRI